MDLSFRRFIKLSKRDYYEVLGVSKDATQQEIRRAYRKLARKYHPDVSKEEDAQEKFIEVKEAYEVLSDDEKRAQYDRFGHAGTSSQGFSGFGGQDLDRKSTCLNSSHVAISYAVFC